MITYKCKQLHITEWDSTSDFVCCDECGRLAFNVRNPQGIPKTPEEPEPFLTIAMIRECKKQLKALEEKAVRFGGMQMSVGLQNAPRNIPCEFEGGCTAQALRVTQDGKGTKLCPKHAAGKLTQAIR